MDLSSLASSPASRMLPHLSPSLNHHHHHLLHAQQQKAAGDGDEEFPSRCSSGSNNSRNNGSSNKMGVEGGSDGSQERPAVTVGHNGELEEQSEGVLGRGFQPIGEKEDHRPRTSAEAHSKPLFPALPLPHHSPMELGADPHQRRHDDDDVKDVEMKEEEDDDDDDPVGCETCGEDFPTMQAYVSHSCALALSTSSLPAVTPPSSTLPARSAEASRATSNSDIGGGDVSSKDMHLTSSKDSTSFNHSAKYSSAVSGGSALQSVSLQDAESFVGKIVYNPDGSAYVIEGGDTDDVDLELLDVPKVEGAIVDREGGRGGGAGSSVAQPIPQIASAVFVPRPFSSWCRAINNVHPDSCRAPPDGAPVMHSFKVYNVRGSENSDKRGRDVVSELQNNNPHHLPAKPILMCFMCKLSFGLPASFTGHAREEHELDLNEEETALLSRPKASAILQSVGKEKSPLLSFLQPLPSSSSASSSAISGVSASASATFPYFLPSSVAGTSPVSKVASAATKVKYMYTAPRVSKDVTMSPPNSGSQGTEENDSRPTSADPWPPRVGEGCGREEQENGSAGVERDELGPIPMKFDWLKSVSSTKSRSPPSTASSEDGGSVSVKPEPLTSINFSSSQDPSFQDYLPPASAPVSLYPGGPLPLLAGGTCDEHPLGRVQGTECPKCDMVLGSSQSLGGHMTMMHSRNSCKTLKCPKCNWHYKYQETLEIHMKEKHPDNDAQCIYCLTNQSHPRLARGETYSCGYKPYRCDVCNYSTTTKGNLSIHMQSDKHMNNMQELANGGSDMTPSPNHAQPQTKTFSPAAAAAHAAAAAAVAVSSGGISAGGEDPMKKLKPKQSWRCDVCNYETLVARNLRIHMTSEKHTHNMMVLQQNMKHMQRDMHLQQLMMIGQQDPLFSLSPGALPSAMYPFDQSLMVPGAPSLYDMSAVGMGRENGALGGEEMTPSIAEASDATLLFQCTICELHSTDSLESLHQHLNVDRTKQRESENISVHNGTYTCHMCQYKTNLKANFQLHCKTDKHLQKLQLTNHIREGGPANEWRLAYLTASNPTTVRCNACNFYASSVHKLQLHATQLAHDSNAHVFRLLQLALARLQQSASTSGAVTTTNPSSSSPRYYYRCVVCASNARTKQAMVRHAMSLKHVQQQQAKQLTLDPRDVFVAVLVRDGETVVFEEAATEGSLCHESEAPINHTITDVSWRRTALEMEGEQRCNDDSIFIGNSPTVRCFHTGVWLSDGICRQRIWRNIPYAIRLHMPTVTKPAPGWTVCYNGTVTASHPLRSSINYLNDNDDVVVHINTRLNVTFSNGTYTDKFTFSERLNGGWTNTVPVLGLNPFPIRLNQLFSMTIKAVSLHEVQFYVDGTLYGRYTTTVSLDTVTNVQPWGQVHVDVINLLCDAQSQS